MTEEWLAWVEGLYRGHEHVAKLCAEVRRLRSILYAVSVDIHNLQVETDCRLHGVDLEAGAE